MPNHSELCFPPLQNVEKVFGKTAALRCLSPDSSGKRQGDVGLGDFSGARQPSLNAGSSLGNAAGCSWTRNFTSLCLTFLIYKMGMMTIVPTSEGCCEGKQMSEYLRGAGDDVAHGRSMYLGRSVTPLQCSFCYRAGLMARGRGLALP